VRRKLIVGAVIVVIALVWLFSSLNDTLTPYISFDEAMQRDQRVQIIGSVLKDEVRYDTDSLKLVFKIENEDHQRLTVVYTGSMPGNFDQAETVVCLGIYRDGRVHADELLLKCPSKYEGGS
jgi:cytochrome c-type biogenesis protein CcmE